MVIHEIYEVAIIYVIKNKWTDEIYIGSSSYSLDEKITAHYNGYFDFINPYCNRKKNWVASYYLIEKFEDDCYIELVEELKNISKRELLNLEGYYQMLYFDKTVNQRISGGNPYVDAGESIGIVKRITRTKLNMRECKLMSLEDVRA
jgi:hypothetical protein